MAVAFVAGILLLAGAPAQGAPARTFSLAYTAELRGNIVPCACPARPLGGLSRRIGWIDSLRTAATGPLFVVDAGRFESYPGGLPFPQGPARDGLRSLLHDGDRAIAYDARVGGAAVPGGLRPNEARRILRDGVAVAFVAIDERIDPAPAAAALRRLEKADVVVLLCSGDLSFATAAAVTVGADVAVVSRGATFFEPLWRDGILYLGPGLDGKYVGLARLAVGPPVHALEVRLRAMDASVPDSPAWKARIEDVLLGVERSQPNALSRGE